MWKCGKRCGKNVKEGDLNAKDWLHFTISLLFHDIGYVKNILPNDDGNYQTINEAGDKVSLESGQTDAPDEHRPGDDAPSLHVPQAGDLPEIKLPGEAVHDRTAREEQQGLEEGVGDQVKDAGKQATGRKGHQHESELTYR